jgi:GR25 family glycosyltransferase involved in LPS biosynthesis
MKAFIIYLPHREHSVKHANYMIEKLKSYKIDAELFIGTNGNDTDEIFTKEERTLYPYGIKNKSLDRTEVSQFLKKDLPLDFWETYSATIVEKSKLSEKEVNKISRPGVKGCFHSHFRLWRHCIDLNEPIMIFEDDVVFYREYIPVEFKDILIISLGKNSFYNEPFKSYLECPSGTAKSIEWKNFSMPGASGYIISPTGAKSLVKFYRHLYTPADNAINKNLVDIKITTFIMGRNTTEDEGNISMTKSKDWE